ncbi:unnamed protein product, partial [Leptidea sinapis]
DSDVEAGYCLGDFNADPDSRLRRPLIFFCNEHELACADLEILAKDSSEYTYIILVGSLCCNQATPPSITSINVLHDVYWSDHMPLTEQCDVEVIQYKVQCNDK